MKNKIMHRLPCAQTFSSAKLVQTRPHQVMSLTAYADQSDSFLLFSYDAGEGVSREILQEDSLYCVLDGHVEFTIEGNVVSLHANETIVIAEGVPHAIVSIQASKIMAIHIGQ